MRPMESKPGLLIAAILHFACVHTCVFLNCLKSTKIQVQLAFYVYSAEQWVACWAKLTGYHSDIQIVDG